MPELPGNNGRTYRRGSAGKEKQMAKCKVCEYCGAYLDFGERCDCRDCEISSDGGSTSGGVAADGSEERNPH